MMFGSNILEVAIGLILIYFLVSLICSAFAEGVSTLFNVRGKALRDMLGRLVGEAVTTALYDHPLVKGAGKARDPSYISPLSFARAALHLYPPDATIAASKAATPISQVYQALETQLAVRGQTMLTGMETWFDEATDRLSGWYKRWASWMILGAGLVTTGLLNIDTVAITNALWSDKTAREALVAVAVKQAEAPAPDTTVPFDTTLKQISQIRDELADVKLPIGWASTALPRGFLPWLYKVLGLLATTLAVSLGAPFWFDLLKKLVNIRGTGPQPEKKPASDSSG